MLQTSKNRMNVKNPAAALLDQDGVFDLTSPTGDVFCVTCQRGIGMSFMKVETERRARASSTWEIRRRSNAVGPSARSESTAA